MAKPAHAMQPSREDPDAKKRKAALRREVAAHVDALSEEEILRQSAAVAAKVLARPEYQRARSVSVYLSFDKELRTDAIVADILRSGRTCYIPRFRAGHAEMEMLRVESEEDLAAMPLNRWSIRQPPDDEERISVFEAGELDLVLLPGQAFAADGLRLGRGKGYYDRFLQRCARDLRSPPATLGLALREQLLPQVPTAAHDMPVHAVLFADA